jgi:hypothetical protein
MSEIIFAAHGVTSALAILHPLSLRTFSRPAIDCMSFTHDDNKTSITNAPHQLRKTRRADGARHRAVQTSQPISILTLQLPVCISLRIPTIATSHSDSSRPPIPIDRDRCGAGFLKAPLDNALHQCLARWANWSSTGEAVPVVNRRDLRATRRALVADAAARAGGAC